jgi:RIO kinase 1
VLLSGVVIGIFHFFLHCIFPLKEGSNLVRKWTVMKIPKRIEPLVEEGLVDEVICQLMSGKEAMVYVVRCGKEIRCAKVYKEIDRRSFRHSGVYMEGRKIKHSRHARALNKGTRYGRKVRHDAWQSVEVDCLHRLAVAGVRVPRPHSFFEGVLLMELVADANGNAAPRLNDVVLTAGQSQKYHQDLLRQVIRMLCTGIVHGDLSKYNVLAGKEGPVIIDLPQAVDAVSNSHAHRLLLRDVDNLAAYFGRFAPELLNTDYGNEIWFLYRSGNLHPDINLSGYTGRQPAGISSATRAAGNVLRRSRTERPYRQAMRG